MPQKKANTSTASMLTNRGLMVGVPLLVSLVFSGIYTVSQQPRNGRATSSTQSVQNTTQSKEVNVIAPPSASKLSTEAADNSSLKPSTQSSNTKDRPTQSSTDATENVQKAIKEQPRQAGNDDAGNLQYKIKL